MGENMKKEQGREDNKNVLPFFFKVVQEEKINSPNPKLEMVNGCLSGHNGDTLNLHLGLKNK